MRNRAIMTIGDAGRNSMHRHRGIICEILDLRVLFTLLAGGPGATSRASAHSGLRVRKSSSIVRENH